MNPTEDPTTPKTEPQAAGEAIGGGPMPEVVRGEKSSHTPPRSEETALQEAARIRELVLELAAKGSPAAGEELRALGPMLVRAVAITRAWSEGRPYLELVRDLCTAYTVYRVERSNRPPHLRS